MKTIAIFHYQVGRTDGVSLEIEKWQRVLEDLGYTVHLCAGDLGTAQGTLIPELYHHRPDAERLNRNTFVALRDYTGDAAYRAELYTLADSIESGLRRFIAEKDIDFLIPQNIWSVAANPSVAIALTRIMRDLHLPALAHNHDFYWERTGGVSLTCATAIELADKYLPPHDPLAHHVVINSLARRELWERKGLRATVVPNVFDFAGPDWRPDDFNRDLRSRLGLRPDDILILQATRIVARKGIELAVDFVRALNAPRRRALLHRRGLYDGRPFDDDGRIVLLLTGYAQDDLGGYTDRLKEKIARSGVHALFAERWIGSHRRAQAGRKTYSLWDSYVHADFVTYPSLWEGWGNQFLEAVRARLPLLLFEYPVYRADIGGHGFRVVSLGHEIAGRDDLGLAQVPPEVIERAADEAVELLTDPDRRREMVEHNFALGRRHYSLDSLRGYLSALLDEF